MPRAPIITEDEEIDLGDGWTQICCGCGLTHDWTYYRRGGRLYGKFKINSRATANARRALKKKVLIIE